MAGMNFKHILIVFVIALLAIAASNKVGFLRNVVGS